MGDDLPTNQVYAVVKFAEKPKLEFFVMAREEIDKGKDIWIVILMDSLNKEESMLVPTVVKTGQDHLLTYVEKTSSSLRS